MWHKTDLYSDCIVHVVHMETWNPPLPIAWECIKCGKEIACHTASDAGYDMFDFDPYPTISHSDIPFKVRPSFPHLFELFLNKTVKKKRSGKRNTWIIRIPACCNRCKASLPDDLFFNLADIEFINNDIGNRNYEHRIAHDSSLVDSPDIFVDRMSQASMDKHVKTLTENIHINIANKSSAELQRDGLAEIGSIESGCRRRKSFNKAFDKLHLAVRLFEKDRNEENKAGIDAAIVNMASVLARPRKNEDNMPVIWDTDFNESAISYRLRWKKWEETLRHCRIFIATDSVRLVEAGHVSSDDKGLVDLKGGFEIYIHEAKLPPDSLFHKKMSTVLAVLPKSKSKNLPQIEIRE